MIDISNNYLNNLPCTLGNLSNLKTFKVTGNPLIELPDNIRNSIIMTTDSNIIINYYKDIQQRQCPWNEVKMMFLGDNNAGNFPFFINYYLLFIIYYYFNNKKLTKIKVKAV